MKHKGIRLTIDKREDKNTISHKFKKDFIDLFEDSKWKREGSILEVSCYRGYTTNVLSHLFKQVYAVEIDKYTLERAKKYNRNRKNIKFITGNVYNSKGWDGLPKADVIFIDCRQGVTTTSYRKRIAICNRMSNCFSAASKLVKFEYPYGAVPDNGAC